MISPYRAPRIVVLALPALMVALLGACGAPAAAPIASAGPSIEAPTPSPAPSAAVVAEPSAGASPSPPVAPSPAAAAVPFLWPEPLPEGLRVDPAQSSFDAGGWTLYLVNPNEPQDQVWIRGGYDLVDEPRTNSRTVTVRGVEGNASTTGAGWGLTWTEALPERPEGAVYNVGGFLRSAEDTVAIAETLQPVDETTFRQRLAGAT